jgi:hypothetical protein
MPGARLIRSFTGVIIMFRTRTADLDATRFHTRWTRIRDAVLTRGQANDEIRDSAFDDVVMPLVAGAGAVYGPGLLRVPLQATTRSRRTG